MRFMILVKASEESEAGVPPSEGMLAAMADYHAQLAQAGVLLDAGGLMSSAEGWRIAWEDGKKTITDGPFAEVKELIAGFTLIEVRLREEALEWTKRFPEPRRENGAIEVRRMLELADPGEGAGVVRFRAMGVGRKGDG